MKLSIKRKAPEKAIVKKGFWGDREVAKKNPGFKSFIDEAAKRRFYHSEGTPYGVNSRNIIYNDYIKNIIKSVPGLLTSFSKFSNSKERRFVDSKGRFEIINVVEQLENRGNIGYKGSPKYDLNKAHIIIINDPIKKVFFVKQKGDTSNIITLGEMLIQNIMKKQGIKTIDSHAAYYSVDLKNLKHKSLVIYDFTNMLTVLDAIKLHKLNKTEIQQIEQKLKKFDELLIKKRYPIWDYAEKKHCFIDLNTKEIYMFDPRIYETNTLFNNLYNLAQKELNLIKK